MTVIFGIYDFLNYSDRIAGSLFRNYMVDCVIDFFRDIPEDVLNTYCWIHSTYTVEGGGIPGKDSAYPGVRPAGPSSIRRPARYYQWVAFVLFIQVRF